MHALFLLAAASGISAHFDIKNALWGENGLHRHEARQLNDDPEPTSLPIMVTITDLDCWNAFTRAADTAPTAPPQLVAHMDDELCMTGLPKNLSSESSSWMSRWASYTSAHGDLFETMKEECPSITSEIALLETMCAETDGARAEDAAPRETAMLLGAALAAAGSIAFML